MGLFTKGWESGGNLEMRMITSHRQHVLEEIEGLKPDQPFSLLFNGTLHTLFTAEVYGCPPMPSVPPCKESSAKEKNDAHN